MARAFLTVNEEASICDKRSLLDPLDDFVTTIRGHGSGQELVQEGVVVGHEQRVQLVVLDGLDLFFGQGQHVICAVHGGKQSHHLDCLCGWGR